MGSATDYIAAGDSTEMNKKLATLLEEQKAIRAVLERLAITLEAHNESPIGGHAGSGLGMRRLK